MIATPVVDCLTVMDLLSAGDNQARVINSDQGAAMLRFDLPGKKAVAVRRIHGGSAPLSLSDMRGSRIIYNAKFASGDRLQFDKTSSLPVAASKAILVQRTVRTASARICITPESTVKEE